MQACKRERKAFRIRRERTSVRLEQVVAAEMVLRKVTLLDKRSARGFSLRFASRRRDFGATLL